MSWFVSREEWLAIYDRIKSMLSGLNYSADQEATNILSSILLYHPNVLEPGDLFDSLSDYDLAVVFGCGESLLRDLNLVKSAVNGARDLLIVASNGAVKVLVEYGLNPHLVVTDLDGDPNYIARASRSGSFVVVHAHGDNIGRLNLVKNLEGPVIGSTQVEPRLHVHNFGGFTDGDRAVYILYHAGYRKVVLAGFDFERPSPCPGKEVRNLGVKKRKLEIARWLISLLEHRGLEVVHARDLLRRPR